MQNTTIFKTHKFGVLCSSPSEFIATIEYFKAQSGFSFGFGADWAFKNKGIENCSKDYPIVSIYADCINFLTESEYKKFIDTLINFDNLHNLETEVKKYSKPIEVQLNSSIKAIVSNMTVTIGMDVYSHEQIEKIYMAIQEKKKSQ